MKQLRDPKFLLSLPGFHSAMVLSEDHPILTSATVNDGLRRVVRYTQLEWITNAQIQDALGKLGAVKSSLGSNDPVRLYVVKYSYQKDESGLSSFSKNGQPVFINEVTLNDAASQPSVTADMINNLYNLKYEQDGGGVITADIHSSTDGLRNVNIGILVSADQGTKEPPTIDPQIGHWDLHFYTVKWIFRAYR